MSKNKATLVRTSRSRWLLISTLFLPLLAYAQEKPLPNKFQIQVGEFFVTRAQTTVSLAATSGVFAAGTILNFEEDLGLSSRENVPRIDGYYRFGKRSRVDFSYFNIKRSGVATTGDETIDFGDISIPPNTPLVQSFFNEEVLKATYGLSFYNAPKAEMGLSAGLFIADIGVGMTAPTLDTSDKAEGTAPLPVVGAYLRYNISRRWRFTAKGDFFYLVVGDYQGNLTDLRLDLEHQTFKNVGFGFGFNSIQTSLKATDGDLTGSFENTISGFQAYVFGAFGRAKYQH
jgi:hypothetical protein